MTLTDVEKQFKDFLVSLDTILVSIEKREQELKALDQQAHEEIAKAAAVKKEQEAREQHIREEKAYIIKVGMEQKAKEKRLADLGTEEQKDKMRKEELEKVKVQLSEDTQKLEELKKSYSYLQALSDDLKKQQAIIDREKTIDKERKEILDAREKRIAQTEERLKKFIQ